MSIDCSLSQFYQPFSKAYESLVDTCSRAEFWQQVKEEVCTPEMLANIGFTIATGFAGGLAGGLVEGRILGVAGFQSLERFGFSYLGKLLAKRQFGEIVFRTLTHQVNLAMVSGVCDLLGGHYSLHSHALSLINFNASHSS